MVTCSLVSFFFFQAEDGIRDTSVTGVQTCALPIYDMLSPREQPAQRFPRAPPHDDRVAERQALEVLEVFGEVPWQAALATDYAVRRNGGNKIDPRVLLLVFLRHRTQFC